MNMTKKININYSSLVGLKAELLRKQTEVNNAKIKTEPANVLPQLSKKRSKKTIVEDVKNKKEIDLEDIVAHKKSKLMLEAKTRLYERLKKSKNNNDKFLVDFKNKFDEPDEKFIDKAICEEHPIEPEENWVEYQDCFGRTRKCLPEDLPYMQRKDDLIKQEIMKKNGNDIKEENTEQSSIIQEKEPEIEIMRRKWEEQTQKLADKFDIHYQDILFDEARAHGVGYYAFSQDEEERAKQQHNLANLRKETEKKQKEMKKVKELKEKIEQNRLKAAKIRQRIRAGLPAEPTEEELAQDNKVIISAAETNDINAKENNDEKNKGKSDEETDKNITDKESDVINEKLVDDEDKIKAFGELLEKKNYWHIMSQEEWVHKCRTQRINEFAPMYDNFVSAGFYRTSQSIDKQSTCKNNEKLDNIETYKLHKAAKEFRTDLNKYEASNDSSDNESISITKNICNDSQNDRNNSAEYNIGINEDNTKHCLLRNIKEPMLNPATSSSNQSPSQRQATVSYPLSHQSNISLQNIYDPCPKVPVSEHHNFSDNINISLPNKNITFAKLNDYTPINNREALPQNINEDNIMAGLKYLREKFEESHYK